MERYRTQSSDTTVEAERLVFDRLRAMEPWERARMVSELSLAARSYALAGLKLRHPGDSEQERHRRLAALLLGDENAIKAFGRTPDDHDP